MIVCSMVMLSSCSSVKFAIMSGDENLQALTKVTDKDSPCITPFGGDDGKDLYFAVQEKGMYYNIYKKDNPFAAAISQKTSGKNRNYSPAYCAANDKIVFRCQNEGSITSDIYIMPNTKGKALTQVTESSDAFENNPCFSKDGKFVVYDKQTYKVKVASTTTLGALIGLRSASYTIYENSEIWLKNLETGETILLGNGYQPNFSPDGKSIAYVKYSSSTNCCNIWTMTIDGENQAQITDAKKGFAMYPRWSPDGQQIVFQSTKKDKRDADIYIVNVDGNNLTQVTVNKSHDGTPYWTTDGYIYFVSDRGDKKGRYQIWRFRMEY